MVELEKNDELTPVSFPQLEKEIDPVFLAIQNAIVEKRLDHKEGIHLDRIYDFAAELDLDISDVSLFVIDKKNQEITAQIFRDAGLSGSAETIQNIDTGGFFQNFGDERKIALAFRGSTDFEQKFSTIFTEGIIVHEMIGHGSHPWDWRRIGFRTYQATAYDKKKDTITINSDDPYRGNVFEEGFAEYLRTLYMSRHITPEITKHFFHNQNLRYYSEYNEKQRDFASGVVSFSSNNYTFNSFPIKYANPRDKKGVLNVTASSAIGGAFELLIRIDPDLFALALKSRRKETSLQALREWPKRIHNLAPNEHLYAKLRRLQYDETGSFQAYGIIATIFPESLSKEPSLWELQRSNYKDVLTRTDETHATIQTECIFPRFSEDPWYEPLHASFQFGLNGLAVFIPKENQPHPLDKDQAINTTFLTTNCHLIFYNTINESSSKAYCFMVHPDFFETRIMEIGDQMGQAQSTKDGFLQVELPQEYGKPQQLLYLKPTII